MGSISESRLHLVKGLIRTLPTASLRSLELALGLTRESPLVEVRELIVHELEYRHVKEAVFAPFLPLFQRREDNINGVEFETWILDNIWSSLEARESEIYQQARYALRVWRDEDPVPVPFFRLVSAAANLCREHPEDIMRAKPRKDDAAEIAEFANYLDMHRILRTALARLPDFMGRIDAEKAAALRLMFRDACALNEESGYRFLEVLFANLQDGSQIIKFVATVSDRPNDRFLASSELADFGERILDIIDERLQDLKSLLGARNRGGDDDLGSAGARVAACLGQLQSFEHYIELSRDGPWGKRVADAHKIIAELVEGQLKAAERTLGDALPMKSERIYGRMKREVPRYEQPAKPELIARAKCVLAFVRDIRSTASSGGYASLHAKTMQGLEAAMDVYFEELLNLANGEDPVEADKAMAAFETVTDLMETLCGEEKSQVSRRRIASSDLYKPRAA